MSEGKERKYERLAGYQGPRRTISGAKGVGVAGTLPMSCISVSQSSELVDVK